MRLSVHRRDVPLLAVLGSVGVLTAVAVFAVITLLVKDERAEAIRRKAVEQAAEKAGQDFKVLGSEQHLAIAEKVGRTAASDASVALAWKHFWASSPADQNSKRGREIRAILTDKQNQLATRRNAADNARKTKDEAVQRAAVGAKILKESMRDPDSFKLESALVIDKTGAVCYTYRARNGFGGINVGNAVLAPDGVQFKTNEMDGFHRLWRKECKDKYGQDVSVALRWFVL